MNWRRTLLILSFVVLAGFLAYIKSDKTIEILAAVGAPIATYVAVKGGGNGKRVE